MKNLNNQSPEDNSKKPVTKGATTHEKVNTIQKIQEFFEKYRKMIMIVSSVVIAAVLLFILVRYLVNKSNETERVEAGVKISRILPYYNGNDYQHALYGDSARKAGGEEIIGLQKIADQYSSCEQGKQAALYAGNCFIYLAKFQDAEKYFNIAMSSSVKLTLEGALAGLGSCKEATGNLDEAIKFYEKAIETSEMSNSKNRYQYFAAMVYEKKGNKEKAGELYKTIINENLVSDTKSEFVMFAKSGLVRLGMEIE